MARRWTVNILTSNYYYDCVLNVPRFYCTQENLSFTVTKFMWKSCSHMLNVAVFIYYYCQYFFHSMASTFSIFNTHPLFAMRSLHLVLCLVKVFMCTTFLAMPNEAVTVHFCNPKILSVAFYSVCQKCRKETLFHLFLYCHERNKI